MNISAPFLRFFAMTALAFLPVRTFSAETDRPIPEPLKIWRQWAIWGEEDKLVPTSYQDSGKHLPFWPSRLSLDLDHKTGRFDLSLTVYNTTWIPLPGSREV